jgi:hypothetical protein
MSEQLTTPPCNVGDLKSAHSIITETKPSWGKEKAALERQLKKL